MDLQNSVIPKNGLFDAPSDKLFPYKHRLFRTQSSQEIYR